MYKYTDSRSYTSTGYSFYTYCHNSKSYIFSKINKNNFSISSIDSVFGISTNNPGQGYNYSSSTAYYHTNLYNVELAVMYEIENEGLLISTKQKSAHDYSSYNTTSSYGCYGIDFYKYSFDTGRITYIADTTNTFSSTLYNKTTRNSLETSKYLDKVMTISDKYIETNEFLYQYFLHEDRYDGTQHTFKLYLGKQNKEDLLSIAFSEVTLNFETEFAIQNEITTLPNYRYSLNNYRNTSFLYGESDQKLFNTRLYHVYTRIINGNEYVFVCYKGIDKSPDFTLGIYVFKVNEEKTQADLISFWKAPGGYLKDIYLIDDNFEKVIAFGEAQYNIIVFDKTTESFKITYSANKSVASMIKTNDNKLYMCLTDYSIECYDLEGAVILDFNFEKTSYNYNNADIDSYISIWAKNADSDYVATNIKLTIVGDAVWKQNGEKTLNTTTSTSGPSNIPFTIKGQTAINVSVDAVI